MTHAKGIEYPTGRAIWSSWTGLLIAGFTLAVPLQGCGDDEGETSVPQAGAGGTPQGERTEDAGQTSNSQAGSGDAGDSSSGGTSGAGPGPDDEVAGAGGTAETEPQGPFALGSVVIDSDGNRTTYVQLIQSLEDGPFTNETAIELPGNGTLLANRGNVYVGLAEEPTWVRYSLNEAGKLEESGRLSFLNYGVTYMDYGNVIIDEETAVSVLSSVLTAVVWNPKTMKIKGEIDLGHLARDGYEVEVWTTAMRDGLVYVPGRWADWEGGRIYPGVSMTIIDPNTLEVIGTAEDDRCASGGRVVFDADGYAYVMGDGRTYSIHMYANASGGSAPDNCLLRIAPGETDFEDDYFYTIRSLTGGLESITELGTAEDGTGIAFAKMFYEDELREDIEPVDFAFWDEPVHKLWRIQLADPPSAEPVEGIAIGSVGFSDVPFHSHLYSGKTLDGVTEVFEVDPKTNSARSRFTMDGYFYGIYDLSE